MKHNQTRFKTLFCLTLIAAWGLLSAPGPALCQTGAKLTLRSQTVNNGGGASRSEHYRLRFSLGQTLPGGESADDRKTLSTGFVSSMAKMAQAAQSPPDDGGGSGDSSDDGGTGGGDSGGGDSGDSGPDSGGSGGGSSCFIRTLWGNPAQTGAQVY